MYVSEKTHPFNYSFLEHDVTSQLLLKGAEDECSLQAPGGSPGEKT